jgi:oligopeptide/dipeptide ABC transporter ATP-binding protein
VDDLAPLPLLEVHDLRKHYPVGGGLLRPPRQVIRVVEGVSFDLHAGQTLGLVGESGSGKTTVGRTILRLVEPTGGRVLLRTGAVPRQQTHEVFQLRERELRRLRRHVQMVFQDPHGSLNPRLTVGVSVAEGMRAHCLSRGAELHERVGQLLERVGLDRGAADKYPHAFSGGQRQRIGIARALAVEPSLLICDEAVSALDVSVQAQVLNLLKDLQQERRLAYLFIAHDLAAVAYVSQRVAVMYAGQIIEIADTADLFARPAHPYARALLAAVPRGLPPGAQSAAADLSAAECGRQFTNTPPPGGPTGCSFRPRCPVALPECASVEPPLLQLGGGHEVRCHRGAESAAVGVK